MPMLNLEHVALNVADPAAMAAWYVKNLGMRIVRQSAVAPYIHLSPTRPAEASSRLQ